MAGVAGVPVAAAGAVMGGGTAGEGAACSLAQPAAVAASARQMPRQALTADKYLRFVILSSSSNRHCWNQLLSGPTIRYFSQKDAFGNFADSGYLICLFDRQNRLFSVP
ncbi:hypothetical protein D3C75_1222710 [compost metagenome]